MRKFEIVREDMRRTSNYIRLPEKSTKCSGYDFFSPIHIIIKSNESKMIWTDVKALFHEDEELLINVRSSMGKYHIMLSNTQGWIESDYYSNDSNDGNIGINLLNLGNEDYEINIGDKIAQCILVKKINFDNGNTEEKRIGGFGSTGK